MVEEVVAVVVAGVAVAVVVVVVVVVVSVLEMVVVSSLLSIGTVGPSAGKHMSTNPFTLIDPAVKTDIYK